MPSFEGKAATRTVLTGEISTSAKIGLALILDPAAIKQIIACQQAMRQIYPLAPVLSTEQNLPHITLIQGRFRSSELFFDLLEKLKDYLQSNKYPVGLTFSELYYRDGGWYYCLLKAAEILKAAHDFVFLSLKDNFVVLEEDREIGKANVSELVRKNWYDYGYGYIGDAFHPHITLGRTSDLDRCADEDKLREIFNSYLAGYQCNIQSLTIYKLGENGCHALTLDSIVV